MKRIRIQCIFFPAAILLLATYGVASAAAQVEPGAPVEVTIPIPPTAVRADGQTHLAYELHITNFYIATGNLTLNRIEVLAQDSGVYPLARYEEQELADLLVHPGAVSDITNKRVIGGGMRAIAFIWLTIKAGAPVPTSLRHRLFFQSTDSSGKSNEEVLDGSLITVRNGPLQIVSSPLRGGIWIAGNGPSNTSYHRRALLAFNGRVTVSQRFAYDFLQLGEDGKAVRGDPSNNENWFGYGAEVLAVADGTVFEVQDGMPDRTPLSPKPSIPAPTTKAVGGNYIILDLGNKTFAFYAHLKPNSIRVKTGDRVRRGQLLGHLGNSGNSDAPHLHFQISDGPAAHDSEGLPFVFESFEVYGQTGLLEALGLESGGTGWKPQSNAAPSKRQREMALENVVIRFP